MEMIPHQGMSLESLSRGVLGMFVLIMVAYALSNNRKKIPWGVVGLGLITQLIIAIGVIKISWIKIFFEYISSFFVKLLEYTQAGTQMLLGEFGDIDQYGFVFVFQALPIIIFFSALTSLFYYFGIIQKLVKFLALGLKKLLGISGSESLAVAGNIFLGQTEAPLLIKAYLEKMTKSELFLVMVGGMATVAGSVMGAYIGFLGGDDPIERLAFAKSLLAASVMAAPGAVVIAKIIYPQREKIPELINVSSDSAGNNLLNAISNGTTEGVKMAVNVGAMLLVFISLIALVNGVFLGFGDAIGLNAWVNENTPFTSFSLEFVMGYLFAPLMWLIGVEADDMALMGQLLGIKIVASEFVGYVQLAELKSVNSTLNLGYQKSVVMATYMLCGFANFASIGIQIGGIGILAPGQRKNLSELGLKAMIAGSIVSLMSATIAGGLIG
uniref:Nucleoside transporter family protein n=1 Tax=uncultured Flavobacteriia bacterium TaxID=212695 RepID=H6REP9_9BACT|nr:Na+ dependent nucleoside transporter [uncultured bacterium]CCF99510.1 nucleoside transporter family protein [uncultured Flavobacteriia bacterium]